MGNLYPTIPAGLQGNETVTNIAQSGKGVQTGSTTSGQVQPPTHGAAGGQNEHTSTRQYAVGGDAGGQKQPTTSGEQRQSVASGQRQPATIGLQQPLFGIVSTDHLLDHNNSLRTPNLDDFWSNDQDKYQSQSLLSSYMYPNPTLSQPSWVNPSNGNAYVNTASPINNSGKSSSLLDAYSNPQLFGPNTHTPNLNQSTPYSYNPNNKLTQNPISNLRDPNSMVTPTQNVVPNNTDNLGSSQHAMMEAHA